MVLLMLMILVEALSQKERFRLAEDVLGVAIDVLGALAVELGLAEDVMVVAVE